MATYKMLSTQRGVREGEVHPVVFHEGQTYEIGDDLAGQLKTLGAIEPSGDEPSVAVVERDSANSHENWLDTDPAVLRHGELTAAEVIAKDESGDPQAAAVQVEGKAEGEEKSLDGAPENKAKKAK